MLRATLTHVDGALEVGCGAGSFAAQLVVRARDVDAIDRAPQMIALARESIPASVDVANIVHHAPPTQSHYRYPV